MEQIIRTAADLEQAFAKKPDLFVKIEGHLSVIASAVLGRFNRDGFKLTFVIEKSRQFEDHWTKPTIEFFVNGKRVYGSGVEFNEQINGTGYFAKASGKYRVTVGAYGDRQSFPERKDGSYNYDSIADKLMVLINAEVADQQRAVIRDSNADALAALRAKHGLDQYDTKVTTTHHHKYGSGEMVSPEGQVFVKLGVQTLTFEQADKLLTFMKDLQS